MWNMTDIVQTIEELSANAWPALQILTYDGWVLRLAGGYTRRSNSVLPLYPAQQDPCRKLAFVEQVYNARQLPAIFKLAGCPSNQALDDYLDTQGYRSEAYTSVQLLDLKGAAGGLTPDVLLSAESGATWQAAYARISGLDAERQARHKQLLDAILLDKCFAWVTLEGRVVGCGLAVAQSGYVGLFDILVAPAYRRRGLGDQIVRALLGWGQQQRAHTAYLQVMCNNLPALRLYQRLGFQQVYCYWYRIQP